MTTRSFVPLAIAAALLVGGCDVLAPYFGQVTTANYRPPVAMGTIRGKVVDRAGNPIVGAEVSNGAAVFYSAYDPVGDNKVIVRDSLFDGTLSDTDSANVPHELPLTAGQFVLTKVAAGLTYVTARFDGAESTPVQVFVNSGTFDVSQKTAAAQGVTELTDPIKIPTDGVVDDTHLNSVRLAGVFSAAGSLIDTVAVASTSTGLTYSTDAVSLKLQAPPGSKGDTVRSVRITYYAGSVDPLSGNPSPLGENDSGPNNALIRTLGSSVTILPATQVRSGTAAYVPVTVANTASVFRTYMVANGSAKVKLELFTSTTADPAQAVALSDRDGKPIQTVLTLRGGQ